MAKSTPDGRPIPAKPTTGAAWAALTWDDLKHWAGSTSVDRGRSYQRGGRVTNLRISPEGALLATVIGTHNYATTVSLREGVDRPALESACSCPIGGNCKHAVAAVAQYLDAVAHSQSVPVAAADDPRWAAATDRTLATGTDADEDSEEDWDEGEDVEAAPRSRAKAPRGDRKPAENWDAKIEKDIRKRSQSDLADLVCSLVRRFPELKREFRERIALEQGDAKQLLREARKQIQKVTSETGWSNHWSDEGHTPDYAPIRHRLERMLDLGHADAVVELGRELITAGLQQIGESHDEGETSEAFRECLPVVFQAVTKSSLSGPDRLLFAIDAIEQDDYDTFNEVCDTVLDAGTPEDWSSVADTLVERLDADAPPGNSISDFSRNYHRDSITDWIAEALANAGREAELGALYEREVRATGSYERLVAFLLKQGRTEDAERWAKEGIVATREKLPGIAANLIKKLGELAKERGQWDTVAAHAADEFISQPSAHTFDAVVKAARHAGVEDAVKAAAQHFLETGTKPYRLIVSAPASAVARQAKSSGRKSAPRGRRAEPAAPPPPDQLVIDPEWPLPLPGYLRPVPKPQSTFYDPGPRPRLDVLLEIAIAAKKPDEVLHWFDSMRAQKLPAGGYSHASHYSDRVAEAVANTYPERAIDVYRAGLDAQLSQANQNAYAAAAGYLRKLRPIYDALGRLAEWTALVASIREKYRNRPRFMEQLDDLESRTIVESVRKSRK